MRSHAAVLLLAGGLAACGDPAAPPLGPDGVQSGTRLRARFRQEPGEGAARELIGWRDLAREEDCGFTRASDGTWRCLPPVQWSETFSDETCTTPLGVGPIGDACWVATPYIGRAALDVCFGELDAVWEIGPRTLPPMVYLRDGSTGTCTAAAPDSTLAYYAVGAQVGLDQFASAQRVLEDGPARLDEVALVAEDGARAPHHLVDGELDARCHMWLLADEERWHCLPIGNGIAYWGDMACSTPIAAAPVACVLEEPYAYVSQTVVDACGFTIRIFERGAELTAPTLYQGDAASCAVVPRPEGEVWYAVGPEVDRTTFATADKAPGEETGRLRGAYLVADDGFRRRAGGYYDTARAEECIPGKTTDGAWRCLPVHFGSLTTYYADPGCVQVMPVFEQAFPACKPPPPASIGIEYVLDAEGCEPWIRPRAIGPELASGSMYRMGAIDCEAVLWDTTTVRYYQVGAELPLTDFVELVETIE